MRNLVTKALIQELQATGVIGIVGLHEILCVSLKVSQLQPI